MTMIRMFFIAMIAALAPTGALLAYESCDLPQPGRWVLETGLTATPVGPAGEPDREEFTLEVKDCGAKLVLTDFGPAETGKVKVVAPDANGSFGYTASYQGMQIGVRMSFLGPETMTGFWNLNGMMQTPGTATFLGANLGGTDPRCDCPDFVNRLREKVEIAEYFMSLYADPRFSTRPEGLDPGIEWTQQRQEDLIDLIEGGLGFAEAVQALNGGGATPTPPQDGGGAATNSAGPGRSLMRAEVVAYTGCGTCRVRWVAKASGCGADILNKATETHEGLHASTCRTAKAAVEASGYSVDVPNYCEMVRDPAFNARNEVEAYKVEIAFVENHFAALCGKPLR